MKNQDNKILFIIIIIIILALLLALFKKSFNSIIEKILILFILFLALYLLTNDILLTITGTFLIFILVNLLIKYRVTIEKFENDKDSKDSKDSKDTKDTKNTKNNELEKVDFNVEPAFDKNIFSTDSFVKSSNGIQELLKKMNGGIELKEDDKKETEILNIDTSKYSDDKKHNALKAAQKETYELINTVNALKDTITTLAPVLQEGKKLMNIFESLKM